MQIPYKLKSSKFLLVIIVSVIGTWFYLKGIGEPTYSQWVSFIQFIVGLYLAANVASKPFNIYNNKKVRINEVISSLQQILINKGQVNWDYAYHIKFQQLFKKDQDRYQETIKSYYKGKGVIAEFKDRLLLISRDQIKQITRDDPILFGQDVITLPEDWVKYFHLIKL